jgi:hypothetical protein
MGNEDYRKAYESAAKELDEILQWMEKGEERVMALRKTMNVLSTLCQQEGVDISEIDRGYGHVLRMMESTLTDDIFKIVSASNFPLTTTEVREQLKELSRIMTDHRNPLASINAILNRLAESGRVEETVKDGRKAWQRSSNHLAGARRAIPPSSSFAAKAFAEEDAKKK